MDGRFAFRVEYRDSNGTARAGTLTTPHGSVRTPAFMAVATRASVKGVLPEQLRAAGAEIILGNTYHLLLRPGPEVIAHLGGLHHFMRWDGPILTDSGGFQVFSLAGRAEVTESGVRFRSHIDGRLIELTPERCVAVQEALGSDIAMVLDHVVPLPNSHEAVADAAQRSIRWAERCRQSQRRGDQWLFAIVQGGLDLELRGDCARRLIELDFPGYAIGGLSVGESAEQMYRVVGHTAPLLPDDRPRYLMGVGRPEDLLEAVRRGVDLFDCVMPTRNGRNAMAFTDHGPIRLRNAAHQNDPSPLEADCPCPACRYSRAYLRHLFVCGEMLGPILVSIHNLTFYYRLLADARRAIVEKRFDHFADEKLSRWRAVEAGASEPNPSAGEDDPNSDRLAEGCSS